MCCTSVPIANFGKPWRTYNKGRGPIGIHLMIIGTLGLKRQTEFNKFTKPIREKARKYKQSKLKRMEYHPLEAPTEKKLSDFAKMLKSASTKSEVLNEKPWRPEVIETPSVTIKPDHVTRKITDITDILAGVADMMEYKTRKYGNASERPLNIFGGKCQYGTRLDEKIARVINSEELQKNDVVDIIGGLVLVCAEKGWKDFTEFKD